MTDSRHSSERSRLLNRRDFLAFTALAAGASTMGACTAFGQTRARILGPQDKMNVGCVGVGGKGRSDMEAVLHCGDNVVAFCDVDRGRMDEAVKAVRERGAKAAQENKPEAHLKDFNPRLYTDYREMLKAEKDLHGVTVSTPDHMHAPVAIAALKRGLHVFVQKPLARTIWECREMKTLARRGGAVTQMGNQGSCANGLRRGIEIIQAGGLGAIREVHVWTNRPIWPQGLDRPAGEDSVPENLNWDAWLGVAPMRPFKKDVYHPFKWRGWFDFGTGALGDMGCHILNFPVRSLKLGYPDEIVPEFASGVHRETYPQSSVIRYQFPARGGMAAVTMMWYDGGKTPAADKVPAIAELEGGKVPNGGCYMVGEKGVLSVRDDYGGNILVKMDGDPRLKSIDKHPAFAGIPETLPRNANIMGEWSAGCKGGPAPSSNFEISAYLTEIVLVGCLALRAGKKIEWDGPNMVARNAPEAASLIKPVYRAGWAV